ncbi:MAG: TIGR04086 family membrane protein [Firmicutes bacterium]|nr:TIGR04086 family membrane protein [[Eubacterium] siraeum]MCM1489042.1 TIGR04086 family membrane protein [Bacillota bacterium]
MKLDPPIYLPYLKALITSLAAFPLSMSLLAAAMYLFQLPKETAPALAVASLCVAALCGGYRLGRFKQRGGIKQGCLCGVSLFVIGLILSLIFGSVSFGGALVRLALCLFFGVFGSVWGVNRRVDK